jgi:hypothetical protein
MSRYHTDTYAEEDAWGGGTFNLRLVLIAYNNEFEVQAYI